MMRRIGPALERRVAVDDGRNGCAARMPDSSRIVVPELAASSGACRRPKPPSPRPAIVIDAGPVRRIVDARAPRRQASVAAQSAPGE